MASADPVPPPPLAAPARPHSLPEDIYAAVIACSFVAFGILLLRQAGLVTGGMAGIALLLSYYLHLPATLLFLLINLPFFWLAARSGGVAFGVKTAIASVAVMLLGLAIPLGIRLDSVQPLFAALFGGSLIGMGVLALARHGAGVGGVGVVALMWQRSRGWNAGRTQMIGDIFILTASLSILDPRRFLLSVVSAAAINGILMVNHRPGRYVGH